MADKPSRIAQNAADRDAIRRSGALQFLLDIVAGKPAPVRDAAGRIVDWTEAPELPLRVSTATSLVKKILPDLAAQSIDVKASADGVLNLVITPGIAPPGSLQEGDDAKVIDGQATDATEPAPKQIEEAETLDALQDLASSRSRAKAPEESTTPSDAEALLQPAPEPASDPPVRRRRGIQKDDDNG